MTFDEALLIVTQACAAIQGDLATHQRVQEALGVVKAKVLEGQIATEV